MFGKLKNKKKERNEDKNQDTTNFSYPSSELILSVLQKEYDYETNRKTRLETKSGALLTFTVAMLTFLITHVKMPTVNGTINGAELLINVLYIMFLIISLITGIIAIISLISVFLVNDYKRIEVSELNENLGSLNRDVVAMSLCNAYKQVVLYSTEKNNKKTKTYRIGTYILLSSILSNVISNLLIIAI